MDWHRINAFFQRESIFCFTTDLDWAPEWAIQELLDIFYGHDVPITAFITHSSEAIKKASTIWNDRLDIGLHPNFLPGSSHGTTLQEQIDNCQKFWPSARSYRAHCFFDVAQVSEEFVKRGFLYDSNLCLFLQPFCVPLQHWSGLIRFPVFWEDDVHYKKGYEFKISLIKRQLFSPGLKVFNFHPFNLALNVPNLEYYEKSKFLYHTNELEAVEKYAYKGEGEKTFLLTMLELLQSSNHTILNLRQLFELLKDM
ncbi:MAG: hypothetical protein Q9P90_00370 [candidate division KSB1 bacterium]|nr:hypothetical protein [candidate division KSB1 bacterium]